VTNPYPRELAVGDVYFTPLLAVLGLSLLATWLSVIALNRLRLARFVRFPSATFLAIMVFYALAFDHWLIRL
jgi:hypothetical protein